jgi:hypothetical protein
MTLFHSLDFAFDQRKQAKERAQAALDQALYARAAESRKMGQRLKKADEKV